MRTLYIESHSFDPYYNLAAEELMMRNIQGKIDTVLLYLWQNEPSVIIGRNQNPFVECEIQVMCQKGVHVVRRKSGGGAVYHDLGNLNYSFMAVEENADKEKWNRIICDAVGMYGLEVSVSGRNDLVINGRKFSGSAFYNKDGVMLHHGTVMVGVNMDDMKTYLSPSRSKLQKHGIHSVEQRVQNLRFFNATVDIEGIKDSIREEFRSAYSSKEISYLEIESWINSDELDCKYKEYSSERFIFDSSVYGGFSDDL